MPYTITNNFASERMHTAFHTETGLSHVDNPVEFIAYIQAKAADSQVQIMSAILTEIVSINRHLSSG
ncbi:MAG: hypothetical protein HN728_04390 [Flavobacteriales bacterium]|jgi:hypothetical protein|nr:hypothetical protein [Flavobacteriales bacterium]MBT6133417.1 hypothetical protein [Flavobacteriales bacterium]MBT7749058.1 hypothetical protein [Flavobacteriales bacterium]